MESYKGFHLMSFRDGMMLSLFENLETLLFTTRGYIRSGIYALLMSYPHRRASSARFPMRTSLTKS
jgi:hypothetical protein